MNVLIIGNGGREHTLAWKIAQSPILTKLFVAPGNPGTAQIAQNLAIDINDFRQIKKVVLENKIELVVVGPEAPLVNGITNYFRNDDTLVDVSVIGPDQKGAQLEGSKSWAKQFMVENNIPTAKYIEVTKENIEEEKDFLKLLKPPYVLKADGLAAGKGVLILDSREKAEVELENMLSGKFGDAGKKVVIEEFLSGIELSVFFLTDGTNFQILPEAKDYKRIGENDTGLNTGGMGAVSPVPFVDNSFMSKVRKQIIKPTISGLQSRGILYKGFVFLGLMNINGNPFVIEYNVRMGDPETEVVFPRLKTDLLSILIATANSSLFEHHIEFDKQVATTVMMVSKGYPEAYEKGKIIAGFNDVDNAIVFHAGTKQKGNDIVTNGGRVITVTGMGNTMEEALNHSYENIQKINFEGKTFRKDIGKDLEIYVRS